MGEREGGKEGSGCKSGLRVKWRKKVRGSLSSFLSLSFPFRHSLRCSMALRQSANGSGGLGVRRGAVRGGGGGGGRQWVQKNNVPIKTLQPVERSQAGIQSKYFKPFHPFFLCSFTQTCLPNQIFFLLISQNQIIHKTDQQIGHDN